MKRSKFSLSHYKLLSCDQGELVPIGLVEVLPGDTIQQATSLLVRVSPLLAPVMHPVHVRVHHWFVPHRIIWDDWEDFITGGPDGQNNSEFPTVTVNSSEGSLADYLGVPPSTGSQVSALPFRAYNLIYNEWYRDQDLIGERAISTASGPDTTTNTTGPDFCAWEKDYFTSARPFAQKGAGVTIPIGMSAPVVRTGPPQFTNGSATGQLSVIDANAVQAGLYPVGVNGATTGALDWAVTGLQADLQAASSVSVRDLREAMAIQRYQEARAKYGSRYTEYLRYLGVRSSDARLQRPEYLGGGKQTIQFSEVLQTGPGADDDGVATLRGHGIGAVRSNRYRRFFEEHGYIVSLLSVKPKTMYAESLNRTWLRREKEHFFQRELQHIGQQEIRNAEVWVGGVDPAGTFGYQDRYDEYRRMESSVAGEFRSTLNHWHYARSFSSQPTLNYDFVRSVPTKRVNADQTSDALWVMANHSIQARRMVAASGGSFIF